MAESDSHKRAKSKTAGRIGCPWVDSIDGSIGARCVSKFKHQT